MSSENSLKNKIEKLYSKKIEADRFVIKYKNRSMSDLEEYYKGVSWALNYSIKILEESSDV